MLLFSYCSCLWVSLVASCFCFDFLAAIYYNLELWPKVTLHAPRFFFFVRMFYHINRRESRTEFWYGICTLKLMTMVKCTLETNKQKLFHQHTIIFLMVIFIIKTRNFARAYVRSIILQLVRNGVLFHFTSAIITDER